MINLNNRTVCSESSLCASMVAKGLSNAMPTAKALIRLGGCPGLAKSSRRELTTLLALSYRGSNLHIRKHFFFYDTLPSATVFTQTDVIFI